MRITDAKMDGTSATVQKILVFKTDAIVEEGTGRIGRITVPFAFEVVSVAADTVTNAGSNTVDVKIGATSVLAAPIELATNATVAGVLSSASNARKGAAGAHISAEVTEAEDAATHVTVQVVIRPQGVRF